MRVLDGELTLQALAPIAAGEDITFCYLSSTPRYVSPLATASLAALPFQERRTRLRASCGFVCQCAACSNDEKEWSRAGRAAARERLLAKRLEKART